MEIAREPSYPLLRSLRVLCLEPGLSVNANVPYLKQITLDEARVTEAGRKRFPFSMPILRDLSLRFESPVTFFVGENGSGKSTLLEAIAIRSGFPMEGGSKYEVGAGHGLGEESELAAAMRAGFATKPRDGFFFRGELQAHFAALLEERREDPGFISDPYKHYGGRSLLERSHGEAFLAVIQNRFDRGLFLLDEPESALSPQRQLTLLSTMYGLVKKGGAQFIVSTHSPILLTYPGAQIISFDDGALAPISLEETSHYQVTLGILEQPENYWAYLKGGE